MNGLGGYNTSNAKFVFEITANGTTKVFTNANAVVAGSGVATVNFKSAFGNANTLPLASYHAQIAGLVPTGQYGALIPDAVQLWAGGPYWATWNVGASVPEEAGWYFWWGDTVGYKRNAANNGWVSARGGTTTIQFLYNAAPANSTYNKPPQQLRDMGYADTVGGRLNANLDAAKANFGGDWRMPTDADIDALVANTTAVWTNNYNNTGVNGRLVRGKTGDFQNRSIFFPAADSGYGSSLSSSGSLGYYWSSTPSSDSYNARNLFFNSGNLNQYDNNGRYCGLSVRAVRDTAP